MLTLVKLELWVIKKILRSLSLFIFLFSTHGFASTPNISPELLDIKSRGDFLSHEDWLGISFSVAEIVKIKKQLEKINGEKLFALSDSYLMVITSQEWAILKSVLKMSDAEEMFKKKKINHTIFKPDCIARLDGKTGDQSYSQWALMLKESEEISDFRSDLRRLFRARGGLGDDFQVSRWQPLLVVGFTSREFFDQDGLIKSSEAKCVYKY